MNNELGPAGKLIAKGWTKRAFARDLNDNVCSTTYKRAVCFCSLGAVDVSYPLWPEYIKARQKLSKAVYDLYGRTDIMLWNDEPGRTHEEVIRVFKQAGI